MSSDGVTRVDGGAGCESSLPVPRAQQSSTGGLVDVECLVSRQFMPRHACLRPVRPVQVAYSVRSGLLFLP